MESGKNKKVSDNIIQHGIAQIDVKTFICAFLVLLTALLLPYAVRVFDVIILIIKGVSSSEKRGSYTFNELLTQDFNQPMNLAYIMLANYTLYILIFGIWYYKHLQHRDSSYDKSQCKRHIGTQLKKLFASPVAYLLIITGIAGQFLIDSVLNLCHSFFPKAFEEYDAMVSGVVGPTSSAPMFIAVLILAPIGEELLFRGLFQGKIADSVKDYPMSMVLILQALCFGLYHGNIIQGIYAFALGLVLGYVAYKACGIIPCIILHMALNSSVLLVKHEYFSSTLTCVVIGIIAAMIFSAGTIYSIKLLNPIQDEA